jgi:hypothetical protein
MVVKELKKASKKCGIFFPKIAEYGLLFVVRFINFLKIIHY